MRDDIPPTGPGLAELAALYLRLGATAFGGPAAHISMLEDEVVRRRNWLSRERFLDLLGTSNLLPGPSSTELAIYIGAARFGWPGLLLGGICFILPAALIVGAIAWAYVRFGSLPQVAGLLYGIKPVVIAIVAQALWNLAPAALKRPELVAIGVVGFILTLLGANVLAVLFGAGMLLAILKAVSRAKAGSRDSGAAPALVPLIAPAAAKAGAVVGLWPLFLVFLKVGAIVFGSGYVLLAFLRADLVEHLHWLSDRQLLDAVAVGQVTPGPVFTTATFIGYVLGGPVGAVIATVGIFLPSFFLVAASGPLLPRLRRSPVSGAFLDGVNAAALALMAGVTLQLARAALVDGLTWAVALASAIALLRFRIGSSWMVLAGGMLGLVSTMLHR